MSRDLFLRSGIEEKIFKGVAGLCGESFAVGRIYIPDVRGQTLPTDASMLCFFEEAADSALFRYLSYTSPAGVIVSSNAISPRLVNLLIRRGIPYLILKGGFSNKYLGKVALLDVDRDMVIIDPELETLNAYPGSKRGVEMCSVVRSEERADSWLVREKGGSALMLDAEAAKRGKSLFDVLSDIAEESCGRSITVGLCTPADKSDRERFFEDVEALFRAAVYGSFSVQLEGYSSPEDIRIALELMHRVFCELEQRGREFNGYLPRGILVSSPIWLFDFCPFPKSDFLTFDFDSITASLLGREVKELSSLDIPQKPIGRIWEQYKSRFLPQCALKAKSRELGKSDTFSRWAEALGIDEVYIS